MRSTFYVTTPIYYPDDETPPLGDEMGGVSVGIPPRSAGLHVNDNPHIGHADMTVPEGWPDAAREGRYAFI